MCASILFILVPFYLSSCGFIRQDQTRAKRVLRNSVCREIPFVIGVAICSRRKLSGWHSFADRCLQGTARLLIYRLIIFATMYRFVFYSTTGGYGRSGSTKGNGRGHQADALSTYRTHIVRVLEAKIRVAYSLVVRKRVGESWCLRRIATRCNAVVKSASLCAFRQPRVVVVEVSALHAFFRLLPATSPVPSRPLPDIGFWISRIRFQMPKWVIGCDTACVHIRCGVNSTM